MRPEKKVVVTTDEDFIEKGVPAEWVPVLRKANINKLEELAAANPNKLFNDMCGLRKKMKLEIPAPTLQEIQSWIS